MTPSFESPSVRRTTARLRASLRRMRATAVPTASPMAVLLLSMTPSSILRHERRDERVVERRRRQDERLLGEDDDADAVGLAAADEVDEHVLGHVEARRRGARGPRARGPGTRVGRASITAAIDPGEVEHEDDVDPLLLLGLPAQHALRPAEREDREHERRAAQDAGRRRAAALASRADRGRAARSSAGRAAARARRRRASSATRRRARRPRERQESADHAGAPEPAERVRRRRMRAGRPGPHRPVARPPRVAARQHRPRRGRAPGRPGCAARRAAARTARCFTMRAPPRRGARGPSPAPASSRGPGAPPPSARAALLERRARASANFTRSHCLEERRHLGHGQAEVTGRGAAPRASRRSSTRGRRTRSEPPGTRGPRRSRGRRTPRSGRVSSRPA